MAERRPSKRQGQHGTWRRRPRQQRAPSRPLRCRREGDRIVFVDRVNPRAVRDFCTVVAEARSARAGFTLSFEDIDRAYPEAMVQLIACVEHFRRQHLTFDLLCPQNRRLNRLFLSTNWAHLLSPTMFGPGDESSDRHLAVRRYTSGAEQHRIVNEVLDRVLGQIDLARPLITALEWSLNEITDNVINHAQAPDGGFVQVSTFRDRRRVKIVVADGGRGVLASMREGFPTLERDTDAIGEAMKHGVTRSKEVGQGNGLAGALHFATASKGSFNIVSGRGEVRVIDESGGGYQHKAVGYRREERFPGTFVGIELGTDTPIDVEEALMVATGDTGFDYLDAAYGEETDPMTLVMREEAAGFGSREVGKRIRTKATNLIRAEPSRRLELDWTGVPSTSSSFADETVGRLFVELGPLAYSERVRCIGMDPLVRKLLDKAINQRIAQSQE